jgi:hypothetical protein
MLTNFGIRHAQAEVQDLSCRDEILDRTGYILDLH